MQIVTKGYNLECFKDKDIHTFDEIINILYDYEEKIREYESKNVILTNTLNDEIALREDFFKPRSLYEVYGVNERDFLWEQQNLRN